MSEPEFFGIAGIIELNNLMSLIRVSLPRTSHQMGLRKSKDLLPDRHKWKTLAPNGVDNAIVIWLGFVGCLRRSFIVYSE